MIIFAIGRIKMGTRLGATPMTKLNVEFPIKLPSQEWVSVVVDGKYCFHARGAPLTYNTSS